MSIHAGNVPEWPTRHRTTPTQRGIIRKRILLALLTGRKLYHPRKAWNLYGEPIMPFVEPYTSQDLTNPADTLVAFSSLIDRLSSYPGKQFAGLWKHNILIGLQWDSGDGRNSQRQSIVCRTFVLMGIEWTHHLVHFRHVPHAKT